METVSYTQLWAKSPAWLVPAMGLGRHHKTVPFGRNLQVEEDFAKLRGWARVGGNSPSTGQATQRGRYRPP